LSRNYKMPEVESEFQVHFFRRMMSVNKSIVSQ